MKLIILTLSVAVLLTAFNSNSFDKGANSKRKPISLTDAKSEATAPDKGISALETQTTNKQTQTAKKVNWAGTWRFSDNAPIKYTLKIKTTPQGGTKGGANCTYNATGIQTFYELNCRGVDKGTSFELYYVGTADGGFYQEDKINRSKPILTLKSVNGKILTYWDQLINNYVEQGNHSGQVCFKKK